MMNLSVVGRFALSPFLELDDPVSSHVGVFPHVPQAFPSDGNAKRGARCCVNHVDRQRFWMASPKSTLGWLRGRRTMTTTVLACGFERLFFGHPCLDQQEVVTCAQRVPAGHPEVLRS